MQSLSPNFPIWLRPLSHTLTHTHTLLHIARRSRRMWPAPLWLCLIPRFVIVLLPLFAAALCVQRQQLRSIFKSAITSSPDFRYHTFLVNGLMLLLLLLLLSASWSANNWNNRGWVIDLARQHYYLDHYGRGAAFRPSARPTPSRSSSSHRGHLSTQPLYYYYFFFMTALIKYMDRYSFWKSIDRMLQILHFIFYTFFQIHFLFFNATCIYRENERLRRRRRRQLLVQQRPTKEKRIATANIR